MPAMTSLARRARDTLSGDAILRTIALATLVRSLGRGVFFTLTTLYFTRIAGLSVGQVATLLAVANAFGVAGSYAGGHLADVLSARRLVRVLFVVEGVGLAGYTLTTQAALATAVAALVTFANRAGNSALSAIIARGFDSRRRVTVRAINRTVTNAGIAAGGGLAGLALLADTAATYRIAMVCAGIGYVAAGWTCRRLPADVDARPGGERSVTAEARHPARDPRYLALTVLSAVFVLQFTIAEMGMPLWITRHTAAPPVMVSVLLLVNTVLVMSLQIPLSRNTHEVPAAARSVLRGGLLMALGCAAYGLSGAGGGTLVAVALLVLGEVAMSLGEVFQQSGVFGLSFELAPDSRAGTYQGFFGMGMGLAQMVFPFVIAHTFLASPLPGWSFVAVLFVAAGLATVRLCRGVGNRLPG